MNDDALNVLMELEHFQPICRPNRPGRWRKGLPLNAKSWLASGAFSPDRHLGMPKLTLKILRELIHHIDTQQVEVHFNDIETIP